MRDVTWSNKGRRFAQRPKKSGAGWLRDRVELFRIVIRVATRVDSRANAAPREHPVPFSECHGLTNKNHGKTIGKP